MCKIITLTNISKVKQRTKLIQAAFDLVSETERDGAGYALTTVNGVFGERTTDPKSFRVTLEGRDALNVAFASNKSESFGNPGKSTGALIVHGRTSTNNVSLDNTHPLKKRDWTLIHNGVVTNHGAKYKQETTNDTEHVLEHLSTGGIDAVATNLTGYYAVSAIAPDGRLHVIRDSIAWLHVGYVKKIDSFIFATSEDHIYDLCETMAWDVTHTSLVDANTYLVFNGSELVSRTEFKSRGYGEIESKHASRSLGRKLETTDFKFDSAGYANDYINDYGEARGYYDTTENIDVDSSMMFLTEVNEHIDSSYTVYDYRHTLMTLGEFAGLTDDQKLSCTVVRQDGTIVCPNDYYRERLYLGAS